MDQSPPIADPGAVELPAEIRVLHVDDDPGYVDVAAEFLKRVDDRLAVTSETDPTAVSDRVGTVDPHCVVSDYDMPRLDGLELFEQLRNRGIDVPFILFTGRGSEEVAADAVSAGVTDYIQKGDSDTYEVLANSVREAVRSRQRKRAVERASDHYTALVESAHLPVYLYDEGGRIRYANEASASLFGTDEAGDLVGLRFEEVTPESAHDAIAARLSHLQSGERVPPTEFLIQGLDGTTRLAKISCAPTPHHGEAVGQTLAHDVTELRGGAAEEALLETILPAALGDTGVGVWVHDREADTLSRYGIGALLGVPGEDLDEGFDAVLDRVHPADRPDLEAAYDRATTEGGSFAVQFRAETPEEYRRFEDRGVALTDGGTVTHLVGVTIDVTGV